MDDPKRCLFQGNHHYKSICILRSRSMLRSNQCSLPQMGKVPSFSFCCFPIILEVGGIAQWNIILLYICALEEKCLHTKAFLWYKTCLNTSSVVGSGEDPPTCVMRKFFLMSLTLTELNLNNYQLNGAKMF